MKLEDNFSIWHPIITRTNPPPPWILLRLQLLWELSSAADYRPTEEADVGREPRRHIYTLMATTMKRDRKTSGKSETHLGKWRRGGGASSSSAFSPRLIIYVVCAFYYYLFTFFWVCGTFLPLFISLSASFYASRQWQAKLTNIVDPHPSMCKHPSNIHLSCISPHRRITRDSKGKFAALDRDLREDVTGLFSCFQQPGLCDGGWKGGKSTRWHAQMRTLQLLPAFANF